MIEPVLTSRTVTTYGAELPGGLFVSIDTLYEIYDGARSDPALFYPGLTDALLDAELVTVAPGGTVMKTDALLPFILALQEQRT